MRITYIFLMILLIVGCRKDLMPQPDYNEFMDHVHNKNLVAAKEMEKKGFDVNSDIAPAGKNTILLSMVRKYNKSIYNEETEKGGKILNDIKWFLENFKVDVNRKSYQRSFEGFIGIFERFWIEDSRTPLSYSLDGGKDRQGDFEMFKLLLFYGANPCIKSKNGVSTFEEILKRDLKEYNEYLKDKSINCPMSK